MAYFGLKIGYFGNIYWDMDFKFVLPFIYINNKWQTKLEVNWTQIDQFSLNSVIFEKDLGQNW